MFRGKYISTTNFLQKFFESQRYRNLYYYFKFGLISDYVAPVYYDAIMDLIREKVNKISPWLSEIKLGDKDDGFHVDFLEKSLKPCEQEDLATLDGRQGSNGFLFLGSGASCGAPEINHILFFSDKDHPFHPYVADTLKPLPSVQEMKNRAIEYCKKLIKKKREDECKAVHMDSEDTVTHSFLREHACLTCLISIRDVRNKNRRGNINGVLLLDGKTILVDCGKTFREAVLRHLAKANISKIDAIFFTHDHADAMGGSDDLRDFQHFSRPSSTLIQYIVCLGNSNEVNNRSGHRRSSAGFELRFYKPDAWLKVFLGSKAFSSLCSHYSYLVEPYIKKNMYSTISVDDKKPVCNGENKLKENNSEGILLENCEYAYTDKNELLLKRKVACLDFTILNDQVIQNETVFNLAGHKDYDFDKICVNSENLENCRIKACRQLEHVLQQELPERITKSFSQIIKNKNDAEKNKTDEQQTTRKFGWLDVATPDNCGFSRLDIPGVNIPVYSFPVYHGGTYVSLGLTVVGKEAFVYISDVTIIPERVLWKLQNGPPITALIIDGIGEKAHASHFSLQQGLDTAALLQPSRVFFVGMSCGVEHFLFQEKLKIWVEKHRAQYLENFKVHSRIEKVSFAYDGYFLPLPSL